MDNYSVEYPEEEDIIAPDIYSPLPKLKPSKQNSDNDSMLYSISKFGNNLSRGLKLNRNFAAPKFK